MNTWEIEQARQQVITAQNKLKEAEMKAHRQFVKQCEAYPAARGGSPMWIIILDTQILQYVTEEQARLNPSSLPSEVPILAEVDAFVRANGEILTVFRMGSPIKRTPPPRPPSPKYEYDPRDWTPN